MIKETLFGALFLALCAAVIAALWWIRWSLGAGATLIVVLFAALVLFDKLMLWFERRRHD